MHMSVSCKALSGCLGDVLKKKTREVRVLYLKYKCLFLRGYGLNLRCVQKKLTEEFQCESSPQNNSVDTARDRMPLRTIL